MKQMSVKTKGKMYMLVLLFGLAAPMIACDDSSGDNPGVNGYLNDPKGAIVQEVNQAYDDSHLDELACEAANIMVNQTTGVNYCGK